MTSIHTQKLYHERATKDGKKEVLYSIYLPEWIGKEVVRVDRFSRQLADSYYEWPYRWVSHVVTLRVKRVTLEYPGLLQFGQHCFAILEYTTGKVIMTHTGEKVQPQALIYMAREGIKLLEKLHSQKSTGVRWWHFS